jgi:hypothetical protein
MLWLHLIEATPDHARFDALAAHLSSYARDWTARELPQQRVLPLMHQAFTENDIPYFVAKGAHLRQVYYNPPYLRPAVDIDTFVRGNDRQAAIDALISRGFEARPLNETLSHELKLTLHNGDIDLHWHLFRPGRAQKGLMTWLFEHREKFGEYWGLDATASLLVMLVHPAITKYLISPTSMLIHAVDQARLIKCGKVDWDELREALRWSGTRTAAWASLHVLQQLAGVKAPGGFMRRIQPGHLHRAYLRQWIDRGWITRAFRYRWLVAGMFSLALQDSVRDALMALRKKGTASNPPLPNLP